MTKKFLRNREGSTEASTRLLTAWILEEELKAAAENMSFMESNKRLNRAEKRQKIG